LNREIALKAPAKRVVVIGPGAAETIFALGAGSKIVGRDSAADFPEAVKKIPVVADFRGPFVEASVAARPDLVLLQGETWGRERVESWQRKIGVPVAALTPTTVKLVQQDADKIAAWLGVAKRNLDIAQYIKSIPETRAFIEISRSPLWTAGQGTLVSDVVEQGQFKNVASDVAGYKAFSKEALLQRQPDVYIVTGKPQDKARIIGELKRDPALGALKCVQRGQVLVIPGDYLLRPGPRLKNGIRTLRDAESSFD
jgi:iron complex transport system substrate-binding protein